MRLLCWQNEDDLSSYFASRSLHKNFQDPRTIPSGRKVCVGGRWWWFEGEFIVSFGPKPGRRLLIWTWTKLNNISKIYFQPPQYPTQLNATCHNTTLRQYLAMAQDIPPAFIPHPLNTPPPSYYYTDEPANKPTRTKLLNNSDTDGREYCIINFYTI